MKKIFAILCATVALFSCSQGDLLETENTQDQTPQGALVNFNITVEEQGTTKALKTGWATGDVIYIKFREIDDKYLTITYNGTNWIAQAYNSTNAATTFVESDFIGLDDAKKSVGAVHFPVAVDATLSGSRLSFQKNSEAVKTYFLYQDGANYTVDGADVTLTLSLQKPTNMVLFHIPGISEANVSDYTLYIDKYPDNLVVHSCTYIENSALSYTDNSATYSGFQGFADENGAIFSVYFFNGHSIGEATTYTFTVKGPVQEYTISGNLTLQSGYQYSLPALNSSKWTPKFRFSTSSTKTVMFSKGNLQYQASTNTWRFAEHQYDVIGEAAGNTTTTGRDTQSDWIDLFGWGTSGYNHGATAYEPWNTSYNITDYYAYGSNYENNLFDGDGKADWGYNAILNGGNTENCGWRTPTNDEWVWIIGPRTSPEPGTNCRNEDKRFMLARITVSGNNYYGLIVFPDGFAGVGSYTYNGTTQQNVSADDWTSMESNGAIFLPMTGERYYQQVTGVATEGLYWSSTASGTSEYRNVRSLSFTNNWFNSAMEKSREYAAAVRLIRDL